MPKDYDRLYEDMKLLNEAYLRDKNRLDFIELILKTGVPIGLKPGGKALVGTVYIEGADSVRDLIDKLIRINNEEEPVPNANPSEFPKEQDSPGH